MRKLLPRKVRKKSVKMPNVQRKIVVREVDYYNKFVTQFLEVSIETRNPILLFIKEVKRAIEESKKML